MRTANFTSSAIHHLVKPGMKGETFSKPGMTYIKHKIWETKLGRSLDTSSGGRETSWGNLVELRVFDLLPLDYIHQSDVRYQHEELPWSGAPDMIKGNVVCDIKCPFTLKSFCEQMEYFGDLEKFKNEKPEYYWQLVSNGILTGLDIAEIILYVPYREELQGIREMTEDYLGDQNKVAWLNWASDGELPYLLREMEYKNLNVFQFEILARDKEYLTERVKLASEFLNGT